MVVTVDPQCEELIRHRNLLSVGVSADESVLEGGIG